MTDPEMAHDYREWSKDELIREIELLRKQKTYGLVWEKDRTKEVFDYFINWAGDKTQEQFEGAEGKFPVLKEVKKNDIVSDEHEPHNVLIEGDNFHALAALNFTHAKSIDVIYIDPPYNTGNNDFKYNDRYVDKEDAYRHSKWLSFMEKRLKLARNLLKDNGLLFISIDENEMAQLKILCDEIFNEANFRNMMVMSRVKKNIMERKLVKSLNSGHGILLFYARSPKGLIVVPTKAQEKGERWHAFDAPGIRPTMEYEIFGRKPPKGRHWMYEETRARELIRNGF